MNHPRLVAGPAGNIAEMAEHGRRVIALVDALEPELPRQQRVAPGGIDQETRQPFGFASLLFDRRDARPLAFIARHW
ncbi:MAG: hypothetical protein WCF15_02185 [Pseudolabrys sp.]